MKNKKNTTIRTASDSNSPEQTDEYVPVAERQAPVLKKIPPKDITIDPKIQPRARLNDEVVAEYAEAIRRGEEFPRLVVVQDGETLYLAEGFHRIDAYKRERIKEVQVEIYTGTRSDAMLHAAGSNGTHGLRRSNEDKHRAVNRMLDDPEWSKWSSDAIARICKVSDRFVVGIRKARPEYSGQQSVKYRTASGRVGQRPLKTGKASAPAAAAEAKPAVSEAETPPEDPPHTTSAESSGVDDIFDVAGSADNESASPLEDPIQPSPLESAVPEKTPGNKEPDFRDDALESTVRRAAKAVEAVVALGEEFASVPEGLRNRLHNAADSLAALLRSNEILEPPAQITEKPVPPSRSTHRRRDVGGGWAQERVW